MKAEVNVVDLQELERLVRRVRKEGLSAEESTKLREGLARCAEYRIRRMKRAPLPKDRAAHVLRILLAQPCVKDPSKTILEDTVEKAQALAAKGYIRVFKSLSHGCGLSESAPRKDRRWERGSASATEATLSRQLRMSSTDPA